MANENKHQTPAPAARSSDPNQRLGKPDGGWRASLYAVIFESDTPTGRAFDLALIGAILLSVLVVVMASVRPFAAQHGDWLEAAEWFFTVLFTIEYVARCVCVKRPAVYARSFFGVIDLLSMLPNYVSLFFPGAHVVLGLRILRLLRIFRILKLTLYIQEYSMLGEGAHGQPPQDLHLPVGSVPDCVLAWHRDVCGRRPRERLHQHSHRRLLGHLDHDHRRLWRPCPQNRHRPHHRLLHDAARLGHSGRPDRHHQLGNHLPARPATASSRACTNCLTTGHDADAHFCKGCGAALEQHD
jgi:hypothetical protein